MTTNKNETMTTYEEMILSLARDRIKEPMKTRELREIQARLISTVENYPVHVACLGECTPSNPIATSYFCHVCDKLVSTSEVAELGEFEDRAPGDIEFLLRASGRLGDDVPIDHIVSAIAEMIMVRVGQEVTADLALERARNISVYVLDLLARR